MAFKETVGNQGIMMNGDGPMMTGTWVNPSTGHKFTVRDCFFQDGNFMVQTTDGQMLDYNTIQHYVQSTDNKPVQVKQPNKPAPTKTAPPQEVMDEILPEDLEAISGSPSLGNINKLPDLRPRYYEPQEDPDLTIIKRVLADKALPVLDAAFSWPDAPVEQLKTLVNVLGIKVESIVSYYLSMIDMSAVMEMTKRVLAESFTNIIKEKPTEAVEKEPVKETKQEQPKPKKSKKK